jgi:hypothetical protein
VGLAPNFVRVDRERVKLWGDLDRDGFVAQLTTWASEIPDVRGRTLEIAAISERGAVSVYAVAGHDRFGNDVHIPMVLVSLVDSGVISHMELFDVEDLDGAVARFHELTTGGGRRQA